MFCCLVKYLDVQILRISRVTEENCGCECYCNNVRLVAALCRLF